MKVWIIGIIPKIKSRPETGIQKKINVQIVSESDGVLLEKIIIASEKFKNTAFNISKVLKFCFVNALQTEGILKRRLFVLYIQNDR